MPDDPDQKLRMSLPLFKALAFSPLFVLLGAYGLATQKPPLASVGMIILGLWGSAVGWGELRRADRAQGGTAPPAPKPPSPGDTHSR